MPQSPLDYPIAEYEPLHDRESGESTVQYLIRQYMHETITDIQNLTRERDWWREHGPLEPELNEETALMLDDYIEKNIEYLDKLKKGQIER